MYIFLGKINKLAERGIKEILGKYLPLYFTEAPACKSPCPVLTLSSAQEKKTEGSSLLNNYRFQCPSGRAETVLRVQPLKTCGSGSYPL